MSADARDSKEDTSENMGGDHNSPAWWIIDLTDADFANAIMSNEKIVVEFWKELCVPCAVMKTIFENVTEQYRGCVNSARARVDSAQAVLKLFDVFNVPTFLFFYNGKVVDALIGIVSEENLKNSLKKLSAM
ncbi:MAG: thioredoxin family protein [Thermoplasmataceae archaeon]